MEEDIETGQMKAETPLVERKLGQEIKPLLEQTWDKAEPEDYWLASLDRILFQQGFARNQWKDFCEKRRLNRDNGYVSCLFSDKDSIFYFNDSWRKIKGLKILPERGDAGGELLQLRLAWMVIKEVNEEVNKELATIDSEEDQPQGGIRRVELFAEKLSEKINQGVKSGKWRSDLKGSFRPFILGICLNQRFENLKEKALKAGTLDLMEKEDRLELEEIMSGKIFRRLLKGTWEPILEMSAEIEDELRGGDALDIGETGSDYLVYTTMQRSSHNVTESESSYVIGKTSGGHGMCPDIETSIPKMTEVARIGNDWLQNTTAWILNDGEMIVFTTNMSILYAITDKCFMGPEGDVVYPDYLFVPDPRLIFKIHLAQLAGGVGVGEISHNIGRIPLVHLKPLRVLRDVGWTSGGVIEGYHRFMQSIRMGEAKFSQK